MTISLNASYSLFSIKVIYSPITQELHGLTQPSSDKDYFISHAQLYSSIYVRIY